MGSVDPALTLNTPVESSGRGRRPFSAGRCGSTADPVTRARRAGAAREWQCSWWCASMEEGLPIVAERTPTNPSRSRWRRVRRSGPRQPSREPAGAPERLPGKPRERGAGTGRGARIAAPPISACSPGCRIGYGGSGGRPRRSVCQRPLGEVVGDRLDRRDERDHRGGDRPDPRWDGRRRQPCRARGGEGLPSVGGHLRRGARRSARGRRRGR